MDESFLQFYQLVILVQRQYGFFLIKKLASSVSQILPSKHKISVYLNIYLNFPCIPKASASMRMFCTTCAVSTAARTGGQEILMIGFTKAWHIWVHSVQPNDTVMLFTSMLIHQRVPPECSWESWQMESKTIPSPTMRFAETWAWFDSRSRKHPHTSQRVKGWNNHFIYGTLRFAAKLFA